MKFEDHVVVTDIVNAIKRHQLDVKTLKEDKTSTFFKFSIEGFSKKEVNEIKDVILAIKKREIDSLKEQLKGF